MRIVAAICFYDEPAEMLERTYQSARGLVDDVVALDGAWKGFPAEHHAWESQASKRTHLYQTASIDADWILVVDADEELLIDDVSRIRQQIMRIDREKAADAINVRVATPGPRDAGGKDTATAPHGVRWQPRLLRADSTLTVGPHSHRTIVTDDAVIQMENVNDRALHVSRRAGRIATIHGLSLVNRTHSRSAERRAAKQAYGKARAERGID